MGKKICAACGEPKDQSDFYRDKRLHDGLYASCKKCSMRAGAKSQKTKKGMIHVAYWAQVHRSSQCSYGEPNYTVNELVAWALDNPVFHRLYDEWVESGHQKMLKPSFDRLDDYKGYSLDRLEIMTWKQNKDKAHADRINGINNKGSKAVKQITIDGDIVAEYYSMKEATRKTGVRFSCISKCCSGDRDTAGGFVWAFKSDKQWPSEESRDV